MIDLAPERIARHLETERYGRSIDVRESTGSTNDDARMALEAGAADGFVVLADHQSAGRGSRGRIWDSPSGTDLYFSIVARIELAPAKLAPLTLAVGLGLARALAALDMRASINLKWPNDVLANGKKCCGILVESSVRGAQVEGVVIGIGIDVNRGHFGADLALIATSLLREHGEPLDRALVLCRALASVEEEVDRFVDYGLPPLVDRVERLLALRGERVRCDEVEGVLLGLAKSGALRIETAAGVREVSSGTLIALEPR